MNEYKIIKRLINGKMRMCIYLPGVDYGKPLIIIGENSRKILCSRAGHQAWKGLGTWGYTEPEFFVFDKCGKDQVTGTGWGFEYDRKNKKEVFQTALACFRATTEEGALKIWRKALDARKKFKKTEL